MSDKEKLADIFEKAFSGYQRELTGTEQEIIAFKLTARLWFEMGVREAAVVFYRHGLKGLQDARAEVDEHFKFLNNS